MKKIQILYTLLIGMLLMTACQSDDATDGIGYLSLDVETVTLINPKTKAPANYNPKQLAVRIVNAQGVVVAQTEDHTQWGSKPIALPIGSYTVQASSKGFDGQESGFDLPYYAGTAPANVEAGKNIPVTVTCTLANVKVTVNYSTDFKKYFKLATTTVSSKKSGINPLNFVMNTTTQSGYFPVADLGVTVKVTNMKDQNFSKSQDITGVQARDHYIINYRIAETGNGNISVEVDPTMKEYTFTFDVSTKPKTSLAMESVDAWGTFAYATGKVAASLPGQQFDDSKFTFEYKTTTDQVWKSVAATKQAEIYQATLTGLTPGTSYQSRLVYKNSAESFSSSESNFTTEATQALPNGNLDDWYQKGKTWYACSEAYMNENGASFWDSSNPGTTTGAGALVNVNPTQGNSNHVHTSGGKSAELKSQYASAFGIGKFAAGSLYSGHFVSLVGTNGAKLNFGQPFTARPSALRGWFKYTSGKIDYVGSNTPQEANIIKGETDDMCSIFIALTTKSFEVDNTNLSTFVDWNNDPAVIAYGELPASEAVTGDWKQFDIKLKYKDLKTKPTHIVIVCSSSKYGDYFTGSTNSVMYLDDMELVYEEPTK